MLLVHLQLLAVRVEYWHLPYLCYNAIFEMATNFPVYIHFSHFFEKCVIVIYLLIYKGNVGSKRMIIYIIILS